MQIKKWKWNPIRRKHHTMTPWGYESDSEDRNLLLPIYNKRLEAYNLDYLEAAKDWLEQGRSSRQVANWLSAATGYKISHTGLRKRVKEDNERFS